ncbi:MULTISPECIES: peptidylprolyl isomerase [unclassified Colwellia]|uniref:peptidylprolyl isomerase n=1 Tax=unclassified Colwellia TaxID=196834 RepID=UPI0015F3FB7C|nr:MULTISPECIES: peptidylprolyl isomerase [unclassified Colwellia]MBA6222962.1 peptidylprolyl isomerase [Colwellia sp. MB3u-45]MBA6266755.1 peptidylprolyl isomerase [Colwellia sp. MB3u-43]MBA6288526.1 peptidylprolyl isomerase [Colwellia sp. MB3u-4]MBA6320567.1 peptidylprolyl isomerase [Colwellia sp. MB02u-19]MBA6323185.1 peptidylprolyl isomerase [Colwellia sp. MB02u-18]
MKIFSVILLLLSFTCSAKNLAIDPDNLFPRVKLETSMGIIIVELDRIRAPITVDNFLTYVVRGEYNNTIFHRIVPEFIVQGGGYSQNFELKKVDNTIINESGNGLKNVIGTIAMAKENRPHTANRQFFFNVADNSSLDPGRHWGYAVFGAIVEGQAVVDAMALVKTDYNGEMGWEDVPIEPIMLIKAILLPAI